MPDLLQSEKTNEIVVALIEVQKNLGGAKKDSVNPFFNTKYADLKSVWDACRGLLSSNGLAIVQQVSRYEGAEIVVITTLAHVSGQWFRSFLPIKPEKNTSQAVGSAISYARRYSLAAIVGIVQEDDDAENAMDRKKTKEAPPAEKLSMEEIEKEYKEVVKKIDSVTKTEGLLILQTELKTKSHIFPEDIKKELRSKFIEKRTSLEEEVQA